MASGHIFKLLAEIKALKLDYEGAVRYLTDKGVEVTGIIKQGLNNFFKKNKARDVDFGSVVKKIPYDDFNVPFNPNNPLKNYSKGKDGVGTLFKNKSKTLADELAQAEGVETFETILPTKKLPDIKMGSRINYEAIADKAGIDVELIRGKNWEEIMEIIKGKADGGRVAEGGRIGLFEGGEMTNADWAAAEEYGRNVENIVSPGGSQQDYEDRYNQMVQRHGGTPDRPPPTNLGGGNNLHLEPVIINKGGPYPQIDKLGFQGHIMNLIARGVVTMEDVVKGEIDPDLFLSYAKDNFNIGAQKTKDDKKVYASGQIGPVTVAGAYGDNTKGIGAGINSGPFQSGLTYNFEDNPSLGMSYNNNGFGVGMNYDFQGKPDVNVTFKKSFKDGGRAGFEIGGLSGEAQSIYDAWLSAGHSEEDVLAYLESRGLYSATPENVGIKSIVNTAPPILPQGGDDDGGNIVTRPSYKYTSKLDAPVGSQAWLNDIGEGTIPKEDITLGTQWNELKHQFSRIPTPLSLAKRGIVGAQNWWSNQRAKNTARQEEQRQEEAAKAVALQSLQLSMARDQAIANQQDWTGESDTYTGGMDTSTGNYYDPYDPGETEAEGGIVGYKSYKDGGLATMFTRRR